MNVYKNLATITVALFLLGILVTVIYLFNLPSQIISAVPSLNSRWNDISSIFYSTFLIVGFELLLGMGAVIFLFLYNQSKDKVNIVYVDKYTSSRDKEESDIVETENTNDYKQEIDSKLKALKGLLTNKKDLKKELDKALSFICNQVEACQGAIFLKNERNGKRVISLFSAYAYNIAESAVLEYEFGEGLTGQAAKEGKMVKIDTVPEGYIKIFSGLGSSSPSNLIFIPIKNAEESLGVVEIASFKKFNKLEEEFLKQLAPILSDYVGQKIVVKERN